MGALGPARSAAWMSGVMLVAMTAAGCGESEQQSGPSSSLDISVIADSGAKARTARLICPGPTAQARDACAALDVVAPDIFDPVPVDRACTMIFGGPERATITGTFDEEQVDAEFNRSNGCEIARWKQIEPALTALGLT